MFKTYIGCICFGLVIVLLNIRLANANSVMIENNISVEANSSGNVVEGAGEVKTGNANASSSSSTTVKGGGDGKSQIEVNAKAEVNGKKVEAEAKEENPKEDISVHKETKEGNSEANIDIDISADNADNKDTVETGQNTNEENKNLLSRITEGISNAARSFWEGIISLFS